MSKSEILRALVTERLSAAAEQICALFERTIAEYEEELSRSKQENQRRQGLLHSVLGPRVLLLRGGTVQTKEEPEQEPEPVPEQSFPPVKSEDCPQTENTEETLGGEEDTQPAHTSERGACWGAPLSSSDSEVEFSVMDGDTQVQITDGVLTAQISHVPETNTSANRRGVHKKHQCPVCDKKFRSKQHLQTHIRVHTGEKPHACSVCNRRFRDASTLRGHMRIHTGERPFICGFCAKTFTQSANLHVHEKRMHAGQMFTCPAYKGHDS
ncbi:replication initiator 1-like [Periophthalmus magnuspinnatus]|uniref:replication initiator 1-like n=1 Tax=Periophthalmus magnuspinnatus TaxID=409849 RepID=UPI00145A9C13|nr:replication initiator 1-like [Periophthalmus magnuspinnatus]